MTRRILTTSCVFLWRIRLLREVREVRWQYQQGVLRRLQFILLQKYIIIGVLFIGCIGVVGVAVIIVLEWKYDIRKYDNMANKESFNANNDKTNFGDLMCFLWRIRLLGEVREVRWQYQHGVHSSTKIHYYRCFVYWVLFCLLGVLGVLVW